MYVDNAFAQSELTTAHETLVERSLGIALREELHIAIHSLSCRSVHDDVNCDAVFGIDDFRVAAEKAKYFLFGQSVRNLLASYVCQPQLTINGGEHK